MLGKLSIWIMFFLDNRDPRDVLLIKELVPILHHQSFIVFFFSNSELQAPLHFWVSKLSPKLPLVLFLSSSQELSINSVFQREQR